MRSSAHQWLSVTSLVCVLLGGPASAISQRASYTVTDLGTLPSGHFSQATLNNSSGLITGASSVADGSQHAVIWAGGQILDISDPGLGGPNSYALGITPGGRAAGVAESSVIDPNNENFCAYFTGFECLPFAWQAGKMIPLPLLGGNNGQGGPVNNRGEVVGVAETGTVDPDCPGTIAANGTGPQVLHFLPVVWEPGTNQARPLSLPPGDTVGEATWLNNSGQAVGTTGTCNNTYPPPFLAGPHAVLWDKDGSVHDLGNLGGTANPAIAGVGNVAFAINDAGQVTGLSALPGSQVVHAFLWSRQTGVIQDLGTYPGDVNSGGLAINRTGDVVGGSLDGPPPLGNARAVIWHNGQITDLNSVVSADTSMYLLTAFGINDAGQIVGFGLDLNTFEVHGFLATPIPGNGGPAARGPIRPPHLSSDNRKAILRRLHF
jgi:probable HAF family extracellular repeat protein